MICRKYLIVDRDFITDRFLNDKKSIYNFCKEDKRIAEIEIDCKGFLRTTNIFQFGKSHFTKIILSRM